MTSNSIKQLVKTLVFALMVIAILLWMPDSNLAVAQTTAAKQRDSQTQVQAKNLGTSRLQFTRYGWQDVDYWIVRPKTEIGLDRVHPVTWGALMLFAVLALVVWSADEVEIDEIFNRKRRARQR